MNFGIISITFDDWLERLPLRVLDVSAQVTASVGCGPNQAQHYREHKQTVVEPKQNDQEKYLQIQAIMFLSVDTANLILKIP